MFCEFCKCEGQEEEDKKEGKPMMDDVAHERSRDCSHTNRMFEKHISVNKLSAIISIIIMPSYWEAIF